MKREENICYIQIVEDELKEIIDIINELNSEVKKDEYNNEVLNMIFSCDKTEKKSKNEKEEILDELIKDFGFDRESVDKIMKENPDLDLNDIINNLLIDDKNEEIIQDEQNELNNEMNINTGVNMNQNFEFINSNNANSLFGTNMNNNTSGLFSNTYNS